MGLEFYVVDEVTAFCFLNGEQSPMLRPNVTYELGAFDKLEPVWRLCREWDVKADFFSDFYIPPELAGVVLRSKEKLLGESFQRRPFGDGANQEAVRFFELLNATAEEGNVLLGLGD